MHATFKDVRPISTGDINNLSQNTRLPKRSSNILSTIIQQNEDSTIRPRAPNAVPKSFNKAADVTLPRRTRNSENQARKQKSQLITELWDSLSHFSKNNLGRCLREEPSSDDVHFVNIHDINNSDGNCHSPGGQNKSDQNTVPFMQRRDCIPTTSGKVSMIASTVFTIPELPSGKKLVFNILSTWGDPYYLGLMGIEIFDKNGHLVKLSNIDTQIWADPPDINILPEYNTDPRTVDNLLDGVNHTCDDLHAWLTPFTSGQNHLIGFELDDITVISMIRVWNYNKNRIHSYRGARYLEITFDDVPIFKGEIRKASGTHSILEYEQCSECILFTTNATILGLIEKYDTAGQAYLQAMSESSNAQNNTANVITLPATALSIYGSGGNGSYKKNKDGSETNIFTPFSTASMLMSRSNSMKTENNGSGSLREQDHSFSEGFSQQQLQLQHSRSVHDVLSQLYGEGILDDLAAAAATVGTTTTAATTMNMSNKEALATLGHYNEISRTSSRCGSSNGDKNGTIRKQINKNENILCVDTADVRIHSTLIPTSQLQLQQLSSTATVSSKSNGNSSSGSSSCIYRPTTALGCDGNGSLEYYSGLMQFITTNNGNNNNNNITNSTSTNNLSPTITRRKLHLNSNEDNSSNSSSSSSSATVTANNDSLIAGLQINTATQDKNHMQLCNNSNSFSNSSNNNIGGGKYNYSSRNASRSNSSKYLVGNNNDGISISCHLDNDIRVEYDPPKVSALQQQQQQQRLLLGSAGGCSTSSSTSHRHNNLNVITATNTNGSSTSTTSSSSLSNDNTTDVVFSGVAASSALSPVRNIKSAHSSSSSASSSGSSRNPQLKSHVQFKPEVFGSVHN